MAHLCLAASMLCGQGTYESAARFSTEAAAEARAEELGVGTAEFLGEDTATVGEFGEFTLRFTVGEAGMATGGGIRVATQHDFEWDMWGGSRLQDQHSSQANFVTYRTSTGASLRWRAVNLNFEYFPWQRMNEFVLEGDPLRSGDVIEIVFGDRSGGSPRVEIQPMDESAFEQRIFVDAFSEGEYLPVSNSPTLKFVGGAASDLVVLAPTDWVVGEEGWVNVWLDDGLGNPATGYNGTVTLVVDADRVKLPQPHAYHEEDRSAFRFKGISFERPGVYRILARARAKSRIVVISNELDMSCQAEDCEFWGPTLDSVDFWGNLRSQRPGTSSFLPVEISVYSIPNL